MLLSCACAISFSSVYRSRRQTAGIFHKLPFVQDFVMEIIQWKDYHKVFSPRVWHQFSRSPQRPPNVRLEFIHQEIWNYCSVPPKYCLEDLSSSFSAHLLNWIIDKEWNVQLWSVIVDELKRSCSDDTLSLHFLCFNESYS